MLRKLRLKFVAICMALVTAVMAVVFFSVYVSFLSSRFPLLLFLVSSLRFSVSYFLLFSLCLSPSPTHSSSLFPSNLWVGITSHFEDGFSCYLLNKIVL